MTEQEFRKLKEEVERARTEADRAKGALQEIRRSLRKEFEVTTLKEARELLKKLTLELEGEEKKLEALTREYRRKWNR